MIGKTVPHYKILGKLGGRGIPSFCKAAGASPEHTVSLQLHHSDLIRHPVAMSCHKGGRWALAIVCFSLVLASEALGQIQNLAFDRLSVEQGLVSSTVYCISQDSRGFIWFGTNGGLCRYDATRFAVYDPMQIHAQSAIHGEGTGICQVVLHLLR
jgi:hypothetical protein